MLDNAGVLYGAAPKAEVHPTVTRAVSRRRSGSWFPWRRS
jgi:hypothetical protein